MGGRPLEWKAEIPDRREEGQTGLSYLRSGRPLFPTGGPGPPGSLTQSLPLWFPSGSPGRSLPGGPAPPRALGGGRPCGR